MFANFQDLEAAHRVLRSELDVDHPSIWKFIKSIRDIQTKKDTEYEYCIAGKPPTRKRNKYLRADVLIYGLVRGFNPLNGMEFLRGIAHNFIMD